jgi:hypothetical protein
MARTRRNFMKPFNIVIILTLILASGSAQAVRSDKFGNKNHVMTCGEIEIISTNYTTRDRGHLFVHGGDIGDVTAIIGSTAVSLGMTEAPETSWLGRNKGVGLFEGGSLRLDLRNTQDRTEIFLEDTRTGNKVKCEVHGDCC